MKRRAFLTGAGSAVAVSAAAPANLPAVRPASTAALPPRKVIVGTVIQPFWVKHPGLEKRLGELRAIVDRMQAESHRNYGRGLDLAILPETAITGEIAAGSTQPGALWEGPVSEAFASKAREHRCYIIVPTYLQEADDHSRRSNAAVLVGRKGELVGLYRKMHLVVSLERKRFEAGSTPGREAPVFDCDFGKLGMQICYDMEFDRGWQELARKGAELVAWPTQSPQTSQPAARARQHRCYIVSSTWRHNASIFEPTGKITAQIRPPESLLVRELDLSYAILPWSSKLRGGKAFDEKYGARAGYRYYEDEDCGIFWSNDPGAPVAHMVRELGLLEDQEEFARVREFYHAAGVPGY